MASRERTDYLASVITTAVEGGIGYWAEHRNYLWNWDDDRNLTAASVEVLERPDGDWQAVSLATIRKGIQVLKKLEMNRDLKAALLVSEAENDAGEVDAELADLIVQAGLFGKIVYG